MQFIAKPAVWLSLVIGLLAAITMALPVNETDLLQKEPTVYDLMATMEHHDYGIVLLGGDGVLRSFSPNMTVLDYAKLNATQIQKLIDDYGRDENLTKAFDGINGHDVVDAMHLTHPQEETLLPADFPHTASTLESRAVHDRAVIPGIPATCPPAECYGKGNCGPDCNDCFTPYPGYVGRCH